MNIEIAERLIKLRKEKGYSQEQLAEKLGVSRQAISKWERAAASPDTDNLICLAKLYGVSLDELLATDQDVEDIINDKKQEEQEHPETHNRGIHIHSKEGDDVHIGISGIHVKDGNEEVHVSFKDGIYVRKENGDEVTVNKDSFKKYYSEHKTITIVEAAVMGGLAILITIIYLLLGFYCPRGWELGWNLYFLIPVVGSVFHVIIDKRLANFAFPVLAAGIYVFIGMYLGLWHPTWIIFLSIPIYYIIASPIDKCLAKYRCRDCFYHDSDNDDYIENEAKQDKE